MLTKRRFLWGLAIVVVAWLQLWSHIGGHLSLVPKFLTQPFEDWEEWRFDVLHREAWETLSSNSSVAYRAKQKIDDILTISGSYNIPLVEMEQFQVELRDRFQEPVSCESLEWLWKRAAALSARAAMYTTQSRPSYELQVLYPMGCPISEEVRRVIEFREEQNPLRKEEEMLQVEPKTVWGVR